MTSETNTRITHFNIPQQRHWIVNANKSVVIAGRAFGKDHGLVSPVIIRNVRGMPRGATAFVVPTYVKAKNDMIGALTKAWEKFGLYEEIDYWIGRFIPANIKHEKAYEHPGEAQYSIFFRNGHVIRIIGLDNKKTANGQSNDYLILNEARFIKHEDFISRVKPTNRGNEDTFFNTLHYHHGMLITTDMPRTSGAKWIKKFEQQVDQERIDLIVSFDYEQRNYIKSLGDRMIGMDPTINQMVRYDQEKLLAAMRELLNKGKLTEALESRFRKELKRLSDILFELRRTATYTMRASTLDNIDAVQPNYIDEMFHDLTPREFNISILNLEEDGAEEPFYSNFNDELHCYDDIDYGYVELFDAHEVMPRPWKKDADLDITRPLQVACDWNKKITCMVIGQEFPFALKITNALFVKDPERIKHLARKFAIYYRDYPCKRLIHHYDSTAIGEDASREISYATEFYNELRDLGWEVEEHYIGQAASHNSRNKLFLRVYAEDDINTKPVRINRTNCGESLVISLSNAGSIETTDPRTGKNIIKKDKRPEASKVLPPEHATHLSDAHDTLYIGVFHDRLGEEDFEADAMT
ncbi:MAG TPA: hypothetical protein VHA56_16140 [Mucilaginibacter sp.]|nr:hypothetical protein [Mucilaginibacter sp.]